jgi:hypothetical protein
MAVLIEGISVVIRTEALLNKFSGGWNAFLSIVPNKTLCSDDEVTRVGFMTPQDVGVFINQLQQSGLEFLNSGNAIDLVVIDQLRGPTTPCGWIEFGHINMNANGNKVAACRLAGSQSMQVVTPNGWKYEDSLSASHGFVSNEDERKNLQFLRNQNGVDVYLDMTTGEEVYVGKTSNK